MGGELEVAGAELGVDDLLSTAVGQEVEDANPQLLVELTPEEMASVVSFVAEVTLWAL